MHHHAAVADFLAQVFFWLSLNAQAPRVPLETLERAQQPVSYEQVLRSLDVRTWEMR